MFARILLSVDISEPDLARPVVAHTVELAKLSGALVRLIYVRPFIVDAAVEHLPPDFFKGEEQQALSDLKSMGDSMDVPKEKISCASPVGTVYDHVIRAAAQFNADLIVVGSNRPSMRNYLLGSNAARIVRYAQCSVLVVRAPASS